MRVCRFVSHVFKAFVLLGCGGVGNWRLTFRDHEVASKRRHQLHSGVAPHFRRRETSLNVVIGELHCHVGEMNKCAKFLSEIHKGKSLQWKSQYRWVYNIIISVY